MTTPQNFFPRLGSLCTGSRCCGCLDGCPTRWKVPLAATLGLTNGSCDGCAQFNLDYVLKSYAPGWWLWENASDYPLFLCSSNADGSRIWAGQAWNSDSIVFVLYRASCGLTITANNDGTCSYILTWDIASAWQYLGDDNVMTPLARHDLGYNECGTLNRATWRYTSSVGEPCNAPKTLTLGTQANDVIAQGFCSMMHVVGATNNPDPNNIGDPSIETTELPEGTFVDDGAFCGPPSFVQTITITPMP